MSIFVWALIYPPQQKGIWKTYLLYISSRHCGYIVSSFFFIVVQVQLSPLLSPDLPTPTSHIQSSPTPLSLSMGPLYMFLDDPSPSLPCYPSSSSPLVTVSLSFISMSLVLFCLLVCFPLLGLYSKNPETPIQKNLCTPMFIAAQFTVAKCWKQPKCLSVNEWIKKLWYIYTVEYDA